jgi:putative SOS response-associated peptidase YedK
VVELPWASCFDPLVPRESSRPAAPWWQSVVDSGVLCAGPGLMLSCLLAAGGGAVAALSFRNVAGAVEDVGMCGRFAMNEKTNAAVEALVGENGMSVLKGWEPQYNINPTDQVPVVRDRAGEREVVMVRWDMIPPGSKEFSHKGRPNTNARIETVNKLGLFKEPFRDHRCLVPALGYYEWVEEPDGKQPFFVHRPGEQIFMAGIVRAWRDPSTEAKEKWKLSMSIITLDAHVAPGEVHDRMPAFLTRDSYDDWLGRHLDDTELLKLLDRASAEVADQLAYYPVSRAVNRSHLGKDADGKTIPNNKPEFVEPIT